MVNTLRIQNDTDISVTNQVDLKNENMFIVLKEFEDSDRLIRSCTGMTRVVNVSRKVNIEWCT